MMLMFMSSMATSVLDSLGPIPILDIIVVIVCIALAVASAAAAVFSVLVFPVVVAITTIPLSPFVNVLILPLAAVVFVPPATVIVILLFGLVVSIFLAALVFEALAFCDVLACCAKSVQKWTVKLTPQLSSSSCVSLNLLLTQHP